MQHEYCHVSSAGTLQSHSLPGQAAPAVGESSLWFPHAHSSVLLFLLNLTQGCDVPIAYPQLAEYADGRFSKVTSKRR